MQKRNRDWFKLIEQHRIERIVSTNYKLTMEDFAEWKRKILQKIDNKIISLKHQIKVHKANVVLKQNAIIEYLNELHKKYVLVPIDKAVLSFRSTLSNLYIIIIQE